MRQALEMALDWIKKQPEETPHTKYDVDTRYVVLKELEAALAQPEQEPVAWMCSDFNLMHRGYSRFSPTRQGEWNIPLYTTPPRREWVGLTDEQKLSLEIQGGKADVMLAELVEQ